MFSNGAALGYRQVPSGAVPDPPVQPLSYNYWYDWGRFVAADQHGGGGALLDVAHRRRPRRRVLFSRTATGESHAPP